MWHHSMDAKLIPDEDLCQWLPCKMMYVSGTWLPLGKLYLIGHTLALLYLIGHALALLYLSDMILPDIIYQTGLCLIDSLR